MSAITEHVPAPREEEYDPHFEPVVRLTEQVIVRTNEEDEDQVDDAKFRAKLFRFATELNEWKERGTGDVRLLQHKESKKIRLVMRRDKTLKVCANHLISSDMKLQPNVGSDRSWVWKVGADYSEDPPTSETLAIRFANPEAANKFKELFEDAQKSNAELSKKSAPPQEPGPAPPKESEPSPVEAEPAPTEEVEPAPANKTDGEKETKEEPEKETEA